MSGRGPGLDRASGSFKHSERYAATAARYSRALERERNVEEVTRDGGGATSKGGGERESLLETPDYLERQRARNDSFKRGCGRMLVFVLVLAVFGAVAAVGFDHFGRNTLGPTPPAPAPVTTDSRQSDRVVNDQPTSRAAAAKYSSPTTEKSAETSPAEVRAPSPEKETTSSSENVTITNGEKDLSGNTVQFEVGFENANAGDDVTVNALVYFCQDDDVCLSRNISFRANIVGADASSSSSSVVNLAYSIPTPEPEMSFVVPQFE